MLESGPTPLMAPPTRSIHAARLVFPCGAASRWTTAATFWPPRQAAPDLGWIRSLVVAEKGTARTSGFLLVGWVEAVRDSGVLDATTRPRYRTAVDALALGSYRGARDLRRRDE